MARFFVDQSAVKEDIIEITDRDDIRHIEKVLRLSPGDIIEVSDSCRYEYSVRLTETSAERVAGRIEDKQSFTREPSLAVTLFQAVPKQGKMETIIQKTVELGIETIIPVFTKRCVVIDNGSFEKKIQRWQRVASEAVKQCRRGKIPEVESAVGFSEMQKRLREGYDLVLFLYENEDGTTIKEVLLDFAKHRRNSAEAGEQKSFGRRAQIALIVGPEGGFTEEEAEALCACGAVSVSLGKTILRTETAGMAALAMVMYQLEL